MKCFPIVSKYVSASLGIFVSSLLMMSCHKTPKFVYEDEYEDEKTVDVFASDENGNTVEIAGGSVIGVYAVDTNGNIFFQEAEVNGDGTIVMQTSDGGGILAYLPYQEDWDTADYTSPRVFTVSDDQSTRRQFDSSDLMIGITNNLTHASASLSFNYMLSKVSVHIIDDTGSYNFSSCEMELTDMCDAVDVYLNRMEVTTISNSRSDIRMLKFSETDRRLTMRAIVAPQNIPAGTPFMKFISPQLTDSFGVPQDTQMESGKSYTFSLRLTETGLVYDGSYISGWEEDGGGNLSFDE